MAALQVGGLGGAGFLPGNSIEQDAQALRRFRMRASGVEARERGVAYDLDAAALSSSLPAAFPSPQAPTSFAAPAQSGS